MGENMSVNKTIHRLSTVDNAISLLTLFLKYESVGLIDVEKEIGISKTAAFRLAATMTDRGFLVKNSKTKRYYPGPILFQLVRKFQVNDIISISQPFIQELAVLTTESVYLSIRSGNKHIFLSGIDSSHPMKVTIPLGDEMDLYYSAAGKLHMAFMSSLDVDNYFKRTVLQNYTPNTLVDSEQLRTELTRIREAGYSTSFGERDSESAGIVAPIWGLGDEPTASLGIYLPMTRMTSEKREELVNLVMDYANKISSNLIDKQ